MLLECVEEDEKMILGSCYDISGRRGKGERRRIVGGG